MANKLQKAATSRTLKHTPEPGSDLWVEKQMPEYVDAKVLKADINQLVLYVDTLRGYMQLLRKGMYDLRKWLLEIELFVNEGERIPTIDDILERLRAMPEMKQKLAKLEEQYTTLRKDLDDALKEE